MATIAHHGDIELGRERRSYVKALIFHLICSIDSKQKLMDGAEADQSRSGIVSKKVLDPWG